MRRRFLIGELSKVTLAVAVGLVPMGAVFAANSATQNLTLEVSAINELTVSGGDITLTVSAASAGSQPTAATSSVATYAITTNVASASTKRITAQLNSNVPSNTTLTTTLAAPTGGTSAGAVTLTTGAIDAVTAIPAVAQSSLQITYSFTATVSAGTVSATGRTVTYTLIDT
jgi:hypothetical protein